MKINLKRFNIILLVLAALVPNVGITINTFGFNWTIGRFLFLVALVLFLRCSDWNIYVDFNKYPWVNLLVFWLIYGIILLVVSPYAPMHNGFVELIAIFNGFLCILILNDLKLDESDIDAMVSLIFAMLLFYILFGLFEIATGFHLPTSVYNDMAVVEDLNVQRSTRGATGLMYGENDFSAMLTCLLPIGLYKRKWRPLFIFSMIGVIIIDLINDANICLFGIALGVAFYLIFMVGLGKTGWKSVRILMFILILILGVYIAFNIKNLSHSVPVLNTIVEQEKGYRLGYGSLYARITIYMDSLKAAVNTYFLGIGPAGFAEYFASHPSKSTLTNPHNMYLEVLVQYGLLITFLFVTGLISMIMTYRNKYRHAKSERFGNRYLALCEVFVVYTVICLASSSFIGYSYQWLLIGIGSALIGQRSLIRGEERESIHKGTRSMPYGRRMIR